MCHRAKNLRNLGNFYVRQDWFHLDNWLGYYGLDFMLKKMDAYTQLPAKTSQQILRLLEKDWKSFRESSSDYKENPHKYKGRPRPPKYKAKNGESIAIFTNQQCSIKDGFLHFPNRSLKQRGLHIEPIKVKYQGPFNQIRIVPMGIRYCVEIVYERDPRPLLLNKNNIIAIDMGLNNIVTFVNNIGLKPIAIKGNVVKSINQFYNKELARLRSQKDKQGIEKETKRIKNLHLKRNNKLHTIFHRISRYFVDYCVEHDIGVIAIGYNKGWKQDVNLGKRTNQNFVQIPFYKFVSMLEDKTELVSVQVVKINEGYTSKCSFLDNEPVEKRKKYLGTRISRGLFKSSKGILINADVNGAYNILKRHSQTPFRLMG